MTNEWTAKLHQSRQFTMSNQEVFSNYNDEWRKKFKVDFFQYTYFQKTKFKVFFNYGVEVNVSLGTVSFLAVWEWKSST